MRPRQPWTCMKSDRLKSSLGATLIRRQEWEALKDLSSITPILTCLQYIPRCICFPLYKRLLQHRVAFNSVQANIVNQTEGLQDFRHGNTLARLVNDDCETLHAHHQACTYSTKSGDVNLSRYICETVYTRLHISLFTCLTSVCSCVLQVARPGEDKKDI